MGTTSWPCGSVSPWRRARAFLVDGGPMCEPLERERGVARMRLSPRDRVCVRQSGWGGGLESAVAPAAGHRQAPHRKLSDDRAAIHRHVAHSAPSAHDLEPAEAGKKREARGDDLFDHRQVAALRIRIAEVE